MARISQIEKERIRKSILDVSKTFFYDLGYENTSTKMIAKEVGIAEGTIFNYFPSKTDILFESMYESSIESSEANEILNIEANIIEALLEFLYKSMGIALKLPRKIMIELTIQGAKMAKKNPKRFMKLAELDFKAMQEIENYFKKLVAKNIISEVNPKILSEIVFSTAVYELMIYYYDKTITMETMKKNIKEKFILIIKGYIKGGSKDEY